MPRTGRPPVHPPGRIAVQVKFAPADLAMIDKMRGKVTRTDWIVGACMGATRTVARPKADSKVAERVVPHQPVEPYSRFTIDDVRPRVAPGSRLKRPPPTR